MFGYIRDLHGGEIPVWNHRIKLVLTGPSMAGKTSLLNALRLGESRLTSAEDERTIGLDIHELILQDMRARGTGEVSVRAFDAGGHDEYQQMLQPFFSVDALYLMLCDVSKPSLPLDNLRQWITRIQSCAPGAVVILVGSHADQADDLNVAKERCQLVLRKLNEVLLTQRQAMASAIAVAERMNKAMPESSCPDSSAGRRLRKLHQLVQKPLRLSQHDVPLSAKTLANVDILRNHILDTLFDEGWPIPRIWNAPARIVRNGMEDFGHARPTSRFMECS